MPEYENEVSSDTGPKTGDEALFERLKSDVIQGHRARSKWRTEAQRAYNFLNNRQWAEEDLIKLAEEHRPAVSFNRVAPIIRAVCGLEINNRQAVAYLPMEQGDVGINELYTSAARWVRAGCDAEDEESDAFEDLLISGEGWTETRMDFDLDPKGKLVVERIDPLEMGVNAGACRANYSDARLFYRVRTMDSYDAKALFGDELNEEALHADWFESAEMPTSGGDGDKTDYPDKTRDDLRRENGMRCKVRVVQVVWWERKKITLVAEAGGTEIQELSKEEFKLYGERVRQMQEAGLEAPQFEATETHKRVYYQAFLGRKLLEKSELNPQEFQFKCMTGYRDREDKCFYGMIRDLFDPQQWANKWLSQTMHIMNTNAKGGFMAEQGTFVDDRAAERDWSDPTKVVWLKQGSLKNGRIQARTATPMPQGLENLIQFAIGSMRDVTGVNLELMGQADREQAAALEQQRRQSAMTILAKMFNNMRRYRKSHGRMLLHFIQLLPDNTLIRISTLGQHKYVPLVKDPNIEKFDTIIDETPSTPDQKQAIWRMTLELLGLGLPFPPNVIMSLLKYSPYPETVVQEIMQAAGMGNQESPEMLKQKLQQAEQALQVLEKTIQDLSEKAEGVEAEQHLERMRVAIEAFRAQTERMKLENDRVQAEAQAEQAKAQANMDFENNERDRQAGVASEVVRAASTKSDQPTDKEPTQAPPQNNGEVLEEVPEIAAMLDGLAQPEPAQAAPIAPIEGM